jgi:hypothetical protein
VPLQVREVLYGLPLIDIRTGGTVAPPCTVTVFGTHELEPSLVKFAKTMLLTEIVTGNWLENKRLPQVVDVVNVVDVVVDVEVIVEAGLGFSVTTHKLVTTAATITVASMTSILTIRPSLL